MNKKIKNISTLEESSREIRKSVIKSLVEAKSGHTAGSLGMADVFTVLYFNILNHNPKKPSWEGRDRLILSAGHICPVWYATLAEAGYFSKNKLMTLRKLGSALQGHPHTYIKYGIENTGGPLGQGISYAIGIAKAFKMDKKKQFVYCIMSDGEQEEGQVWEAAQFAAHNKLDNLIAIIDRNNIQIDGYVSDIMGIDPIADKYRAFGWHVQEIDGHSIESIIDACNKAKSVRAVPSIIIAYTTPGKGVDFMEDEFIWHGKPPTPEEGEKALAQLTKKK